MESAALTVEQKTDERQSPARGFLLPPLQSLHLLPLKYHWEFTRRHPYYLQFWSLAHQYHAGVLSDPA